MSIETHRTFNTDQDIADHINRPPGTELLTLLPKPGLTGEMRVEQIFTGLLGFCLHNFCTEERRREWRSIVMALALTTCRDLPKEQLPRGCGVLCFGIVTGKN
jgi:hypothetical protein